MVARWAIENRSFSFELSDVVKNLPTCRLTQQTRSKRIYQLSSEEPEFDPRWMEASIPKRDWHFHRQLFLRYGVVLAPGQFSKIIADLRRGQARLVKGKGKRGSIYSVRIKEAGGRVYVYAIDCVPITAWPLKAAKRLAKKAALLPNGPGRPSQR